MPNWAIVIGINDYWEPAASLKGAVSDALKMVQWLTSQDGGNVPPRNLYLMTNPSPPPLTSPLPAGINVRDAKFDTLVDVGVDLINKSNGKGERFFFYFSGHGLVNNHFGGESSLTFSDFSPNAPHKSVTIPSVREYFGNTAFTEQFFFFDACRNRLNWTRPFKVSEFPFPGEEDPSRLQRVSQCVLSATSPLLRAVEMNEQGAFTANLLDGLAGKGTAKIYDKDADEYVVRVDRLFSYVKDTVDKKKILVTAPPDKPLYQRVYPETKNVSVPPTLARIPNDAIDAVNLDIFIEPDGVWNQTDVQIRVTSEDTEYDKTISPVTGVPVPLPPVILPKSYVLRAEAKGYRPEQRRWPIDLYDSVTAKLKLSPMEVTGGGIGPGDPPSAEVENVSKSTRSLAELAPDFPAPSGGSVFRSFDDTPKVAVLTAKSSDPLAPIEICDNKGELKAQGFGEVIAKGLEPGFYRARLVTPEGRTAEELVDLSPGEIEEVSLDAPSLPNSGLFKEVVDQTDFYASDEDHMLRLSDTAVGPIATPQLTTMLALAGCVVRQQYEGGQKNAQLGLPSFQEITSPSAKHGLRIICADEATHTEGTHNYLSGVLLRFWRQDGGAGENGVTGRLSPSQSLTGIGDFAVEVEPGKYFLEIAVSDRPPAFFSIAILPNRLTLIVLHRRVDSSVRILSFCPSTQPPPPEETPLKIATKLRRLELLQRFYIADRVDGRHAMRNAIELLHAKWIDPLAGCLGGYTMLKLGQPEELSRAVDNMKRIYNELPDTHVLAAEYYQSLETANSEDQARESYETVLKLGLPVFAEGLMRLVSGIKRFDVQHPLVDEVKQVFEKRVRNLLWTAWTNEDNL